MPCDPAQPVNNSALSSTVMRAQMQALNADIQTRATGGDLTAVLAGTAVNPGGVQTLAEQGTTFSDGDDQTLSAKIDELILALRRV